MRGFGATAVRCPAMSYLSAAAASGKRPRAFVTRDVGNTDPPALSGRAYLRLLIAFGGSPKLL